MKILPTLDAHAHLDPARTSDELADSGAVLAMTISLNEAANIVNRSEPIITWGVGCHPRKLKYQESFDAELFSKLVRQTAIVGEIGLDMGSRVPLETQLKIFRQELKVVQEIPRFVSIHSYRATGLVIQELKQKPIVAPVLHWWTGTMEETREAVSLGCYFSVHSGVARHSKFHTAVPRERILVESDHGYTDPPAAIPCRVGWVEHLVAQQLRLDVEDTRQLIWRNFAAIARSTDTEKLLPEPIKAILEEVGTE